MAALAIGCELDECARILREPAERVVDFSVSISVASHHDALTV
jgi:hypothetical protein